MEVRGRQPGEAHPAQQSFDEARARAARTTRSKVQSAREVLTDRGQSRDRLDLRESIRDVAEGVDTGRAERLAELKEEHDAGRLNTPERIERSAHRILGGENG